MNSVFKKT